MNTTQALVTRIGSKVYLTSIARKKHRWKETAPRCDATAMRKHQHGAAWAVRWAMRILHLLTLAFHCSTFFFCCVLEHLLNFACFLQRAGLCFPYVVFGSLASRACGQQQKTTSQ